MTTDEILRKIIRRYGVETENIRTMQIIESRAYLPEALTDGKLYRAAAEVLVKDPMYQTVNDVNKVARMIQNDLNAQAGIGMNAITPEVNEDQIDGIITGICNAETYAGSEELFMDQLGNFLEGHVDDFVRENADFQSNAGLTVIVQRIADGKCCKWCSNLAGSWLYDQVRDRGNDIWKRHNNCHCQIIYDPRPGT